MSKRRNAAARRRSALKGWQTRRKNAKEEARYEKSRHPDKKYRQSLAGSIQPGPDRRTRRSNADFKRRSQAAQKGWKTRRRNQRKAKEQQKQREEVFAQPKLNREYLVTAYFETRLKGRTKRHYIIEDHIVIAPDGSTDEEVIEILIENWKGKKWSKKTLRELFNNPKLIVWIVPRDQPTSGPIGAERNDARKPGRRRRKKK